MIRELFLRDSLLWSCVWQSTIFIVVGLLGSFILRHRSSRAHQVLLLSMIAAVIVPIMSILVKHYELGLFVAEPVVMQSQAEDRAITSNYGAPGIISAENIEHKPGAIEKDLPSAMAGSEIARFPWRSVVLYGWIAASLILATRLVVTFVLGVRLLGRALPLKCGRIKEAVHQAGTKLGIDKDVTVRSSQGVRCPVIWCWRRRPILLVPSAAGRFDNGVDWAGVLCHELAHWKRRDHISGLLAELAVCILPWHPLLWWAKSRLVRLSEQACDDWVVASGQPGTDYAESLLDLTPQGQMAFVPAVVSSKRGLAGRVRRILKDSCGNPRTGAIWALAVSVVVVCLAVGVAFAKTRPAETEAATEQKPLMVQKLFKLKHHNSSQMAQIVRPLLSNTGHISADERTNNLLIIDTVENLKRIEKIIAQFDVSKVGQTVTEIFEIRYANPVEIVELLKKLINGPPGFGSIIEPGKEPIVLVPKPRRKWIIAKASPENIKQIGEWIAKLDREEPAPASLEQIDQQIIKQQKILKMRKDCINNDPVVKALSENVANAEKELIAARQKFTQLHPEVQQKAEYLQILKKRLDERITAVGKSFDDMMLPEPNLPLAPKVPLVSNTFIDDPLLNALQSIAAATNVTIIPDETVVGNVSCTLKDVPLETALDIVLGGTPYVWKKTPYYYLVVSGVEPPEIEKRFESARKLSNLGKALLIYANDHDDKYPDSLHHLSEYLNVEELKWVLANLKYLAYGKTIAVRPDAVIAYDKMMLAERKGTNVLFNDSHVEFVKPERLKKLGIGATAILIDTRVLSVSEDFLKDVGLDANSVHTSDVWSEHLVADPDAEPNSETYSLILDDLHVSFLFKAVGAHKGVKMLAAPQVLTREGTTAEIAIMTEEYYVLGYKEPNRPSDEPVPKKEKVELGTRIWLKPELTPDKENVRLDFKLEIRQLLGYEERKYKGKFVYIVPLTEVVSTQTQLVVPDGKTLLIGGLKIIGQVESRSGGPFLSKLPLIGRLFRRSDKIKEQRLLLILVKPIINPQQKASKILPGEADSEELIKHLGRLLEKKINPPAD